MNIQNIISGFIGSIFVGIFLTFSGSKLLRTKIPRRLISFAILMGLILFATISYLFLDNGAKMMIVYIVVLFAYKTMFKKNISQCAIAALISYLLLVIGELLFMFGIAIADQMSDLSNTDVFKGNIVANFFISSFAMLLLLLVYKPINKIIAKTKENNKFTLVFTFAILLMAICSLFYKISMNHFKFDETLILNGMLIISLTYIGLIIIKQRYDKSKISDEYEKYVEYSKQSEQLVEQYSISQHENKNELIIIKSMVHKNNKKLLEYLDEIITSKDNIENAWIRYLRYIPFGGLKGIVHNKISVMKEQGINVFLNISKEIEKTNLKNLTMKENNQLSKIIGVFLDNAKEASLLSKEKEVSICIYAEDGNVIFEISNSYHDEVDLNKIYDAGHSTKGKNRGYGLSLVKTIVDESKIFDNQTKIVNNYFVQSLKVNMQK